MAAGRPSVAVRPTAARPYPMPEGHRDGPWWLHTAAAGDKAEQNEAEK